MAKLTFRRSTRTIILTSSDHKILGIWKAHNDIVPLEHGHHHVVFPLGTWTYDRYEAHQGENLNHAAFHDRFGGMGIHLFNVHGLTGMGVHSGRTTGEPFKLGGKTLGCIRVTREAMTAITTTHRQGDRIANITVEP
jgi:hypothetical protein